MFQAIKNLFSSKSIPQNEEVLKRTDGKALAYVTERFCDDGNVTESVIGKQGRINTYSDVITIVCNGTPVFICEKSTAECHELMSLGGVIVKGIDNDTKQPRTVVAYYEYYRK